MIVTVELEQMTTRRDLLRLFDLFTLNLIDLNPSIV